MDNKKENLSINMSYDETQTIPLALHEMHMARNDRRAKHIIIGFSSTIIALVSIIIAIIIATTYERLQYDYVGSVDTNGVYNLVDSQGNVLTSDISPEDVIRILETLGDGQSEGSKGP